MVGMYLTILQ